MPWGLRLSPRKCQHTGILGVLHSVSAQPVSHPVWLLNGHPLGGQLQGTPDPD